MKSFGRVAVKMTILCVLSAMPLVAQIDHGIDFTTSFPFYVGNTKMPAGSYRITQTETEASELLLIRSNDSKGSAYVDFIPTESVEPHAHSDVTFHKYGDTEYLNRIWVEGQQYGMKVDPTKAELKAALTVDVVEHSIPAQKR
jgi:hypothetical protein